MLQRTLLLFLIFFGLIAASDDKSDPFHSLPDSILAGYVDTRSGGLIFHTVDIAVPGARPILIDRIFHNNDTPYVFGRYWGFGQFGYITRDSSMNNYLQHQFDSVHVYASYDEIIPKSIRKETNLRGNRTSGRFHKRNHKIQTQSKPKRRVWISSDWEWKTFDEQNCKRWRRSDGLKIKYAYKSWNLPKKLSLISRTKEKLLNINLSYNNDALIEEISTRSGTVRYRYKKSLEHQGLFPDKGNKLLAGVIRTQGVDESYIYEISPCTKKERLRERSFPDGRFVRFGYYEENNPKSPDYWLRNKVHYLEEPAGHNGETVMTHIFEYHVNFNTGATMTAEKDPLGTRTDYHFDPFGRPVNTFRYLDDQPFIRERLEWSEEGFLTFQQKTSINGECLFTKKITNDASGNPIREEIEGNHTGENSVRVIEREFEHHFVVSEKEGNREIKTVYVPTTDLILAKYLLVDGKITHRFFYDYDDHANIWREIEDDGTGSAQNDMTGVSLRNIKQMAVSRVEPLGVPTIIDQKIWTPNGGERLVSREEIAYNSFAEPIRKCFRGADFSILGEERWEYDYKKRPNLYIDRLGRKTVFHYDLNGNLTMKELPDGKVVINHYDKMNRLVKEEEVWPTGHRFTSEKVYDIKGRLLSDVNPLGGVTHYFYDQLSRLTKVIAPNASVSHLRYSAHDEYTYIDSPDGGTITVGKTLTGKMFLKMTPEGRKSTFRYNLQDELIEETRPDGSRIVIERDALNRPVKKSLIGLSGEIIEENTFRYEGAFLVETDGPQGKVKKSYDALGRLSEEISSSGRTSFEYDAFSRLVKTKCYIDNERFLLTESIKDAAGREVEERISDENGHLLRLVKKEYDAADRIVCEEVHEGNGIKKRTFSYYGDGSLRTETDPDGKTTQYFIEIKDGKKISTAVFPDGKIAKSFTDWQNRLVQKEEYSAFGDLVLKTTYSHTLGGKISSVKREINGVFEEDHFTYDLDGLCISHTHISAAGGRKTTVKSYDSTGKEILVRNFDGTEIYRNYNLLGLLTREYDDAGSLEKSFEYKRGKPVRLIDHAQDTVIERTYDESGRLIRESLPAGEVLYSYDSLDRLTSLDMPGDVRIDYEWEGLYWKEAKRSGTKSYQLEIERGLDGRALAYTFPGSCAEYFYTPSGRRIETLHPHWTEKVERDLRNRVICHKRGSFIQRYSYTKNDFLKKESGSFNYDYSYSPAGYRISKNGEDTKLDDNCLPTAGNIAHNGRGERVKDGDLKLAYDTSGRLISATSPNEKIVYRYDALGRRISKETSRETVHYLWVGNHEVGDGKVLRLLAPYPDKEAATLAIEENGETHFVLTDIRGSISALFNASGELVEELGESAFTPEGGSRSPWRLFGKRLDEETGYLYFGARYFDPKTGLWLTPDPLGFSAGPYPYAFADNDPVNGRDPFGLLSMKDHLDVEFCPKVPTFEEHYRNRCDNYFKPRMYKDYEASTKDMTVWNCVRNGNTMQMFEYLTPRKAEHNGKDYEILLECPYGKLMRIQGESFGPHRARVIANGIQNGIGDLLDLGFQIKNTDRQTIYMRYSMCSSFFDDIKEAQNIISGSSLAIDFCSYSLKRLVRECGGVEKARIYDFSHSRGAALFQMACLDIPEIARKCIIGRTYGSPLLCEDSICQDLIHTVGTCDPVPFVDTFRRLNASKKSYIDIVTSVGTVSEYHNWMGETYKKQFIEHMKKITGANYSEL